MSCVQAATITLATAHDQIVSAKLECDWLAGTMALRIHDDEILGVEAYAAELELLINGANQVHCSRNTCAGCSVAILTLFNN